MCSDERVFCSDEYRVRGKSRNEGRNKKFCCGKLGKSTENPTIWGRWLKGSSEFLDMK